MPIPPLPYYAAQVCGEGCGDRGRRREFYRSVVQPGARSLCLHHLSGERLGCAIARGGESTAARQDYYNRQFAITYRYWFETLYKDKYFYLGEADLMSAALLLDVGT